MKFRQRLQSHTIFRSGTESSRIGTLGRLAKRPKSSRLADSEQRPAGVVAIAGKLAGMTASEAGRVRH
jgi:hypothetical protein